MKRELLLACAMLLAGTMISEAVPSVVRGAAAREAVRQDTTWTSENIQKNPYLFL